MVQGRKYKECGAPDDRQTTYAPLLNGLILASCRKRNGRFQRRVSRYGLETYSELCLEHWGNRIATAFPTCRFASTLTVWVG